MTNRLSLGDQIRGEALMQQANELTALREDVSPVIGVALALTNSRYFTTAGVLGAIYTDYKDGDKAREGAAILGIETSVEGAISDPAADKTLANSLMLGLFARFVREKSPVGAAIMATNYAASKRRDQKMQESRALALEHRLDPKAIPINKVKFAAQMVGNTLLSSPFSHKKRVRKIGYAALSAGTAIGIIGETIFRSRVQTAIAKKELLLASKCPDTVLANEL